MLEIQTQRTEKRATPLLSAKHDLNPKHSSHRTTSPRLSRGWGSPRRAPGTPGAQQTPGLSVRAQAPPRGTLGLPAPSPVKSDCHQQPTWCISGPCPARLRCSETPHYKIILKNSSCYAAVKDDRRMLLFTAAQARRQASGRPTVRPQKCRAPLRGL